MATTKTKKPTKTPLLPPQTTIDPSKIYGFDEAVRNFETNPASLDFPKHPVFPNPRISRGEASMEIIDSVREGRKLRVPLLTMEHEGEVVLLDGETRLIGVAKERAVDASAFPEVPISVYTAETVEEAIAVMYQVNRDREDIDAILFARFLHKAHTDSGKTVQELAKIIGEPHRGGVRKVTWLLELAESEALQDATKSLTPEVTEQIANRFDTEEEREAKIEETKQVAEKVKEEAKAKGKPVTHEQAVKTAAKQTKATRTNKTALGIHDVMHRAMQAIKDLRRLEPADFDNWIADLRSDKDTEDIEEWYLDIPQADYYLLRFMILCECAHLSPTSVNCDDPFNSVRETVLNYLAELDERALKQVLPNDNTKT